MSGLRATMLRSGLGLAGLLVLFGGLLGLLHEPGLRVRIDATRTRAYALAPSTQALLASLEGDWRIEVVLAGDVGDATLRRQVAEVLRRFDEASPALEVVRTDPADPAGFAAIDRLVSELARRERSELDRWDAAVARGRSALEALVVFAAAQSAALEGLVGSLPATDPATESLAQRTGLLGILAAEGSLLVEEVDTAMRPSGGRPTADYESARSILVASLDRWADELVAIAGVLDDLAVRAQTPALGRTASAYRDEASRLAAASVPLGTLRVPEVARTGAALVEGELAVVLGPTGAVTVPGSLLLPRLAGGLEEEGAAVSLDRRFRGEQVLAAAIRDLVGGTPPPVVFVHAEERSLLRPAADGSGADLAGAAALLRANRRPVLEWRVTEAPRPVAERAAWVIVPPLRRPRLEPAAPEQRLLQAARELVADGEPVLLSVNPSPLPRYGAPDPWQRIAGSLGVAARTDVVLFEAVPIGGTTGFVRQASHSTETPVADPSASPLAAVLDGQRTTLSIPVPLEAADDAAGGVAPIVVAPASGNRWLEADWIGRLEAARTDERGEAIAGSVLLAVALDRPSGRAVVVGSGGWMLSRVLDAAADLGDGRAALVNPGNQDLLLAATAWLSGADDLVVATAAGAQVSRLRGLDGATRVRWSLLAVLGVPGLCLVGGIVLALGRRSR